VKHQRFLLIVVLLLCATVLRGQTLASAVRLSPDIAVVNTVIYGNAGYQPLSDGVSGNHSAFDFNISGNQNVYLSEHPFVDLFRIDVSSPAFNAGTIEGLRDSDTLDLDGNPRFSACAIDIGAFEYPLYFAPLQIQFSIIEPDNRTCDNGRIFVTVFDNTDFSHVFFWEQDEEFFSDNQNLSNLSVGNYKLFIHREGHVFCEGDTFNFSLVDCHYVPTLRLYSLYISPNNDGLNDYLYIPNIELFTNNRVTIFNAFGEIIFQENNYDNVNVRWDGRNRRGQLVPDGVYYYVVESDGVQTMGGWILMRISN